ncbi:MAG TPA: protease complex subunit PrcB family protein [Gemmatimonadales bacterium]|nr:protease complex subunit PrcB family protein [Gemmatimonadales bacterium]
MHWQTLWQRFETFSWRDDGTLIHTAAPPIDFRHYQLVAAALGNLSGCLNQFWWIQSIRTTADSIVVEVQGPEDGQITCAMEIQPVDVVRIPQTTKRIVFRSTTPRLAVPDSAPWWNAPNWAVWDSLDPDRREVFLTAWARDPTTRPADLVEVARRGGGDWTIARILLERPEVLRSSAALVGLVRAPNEDGQTARHLLLANYGVDLAEDAATTPTVLRVLIDGLGEDTVFGAAARALLANATVRGAQDLLREVIIRTDKYPAVFREACRLYLARWPAWERVPDAKGNLTTSWANSTPCPDLPPFPH